MKSNWMQQIQTLIGQKAGAMGGAEGIGKLLAPTALGGPVGVLLANKSSRKLVGKFGKNALIVGGSAAVGAVLWNKYKQRVKETHQGEPRFGLQTTPVDLRAKRPVQALVFAAKSDGHIDADEQRAIDHSPRSCRWGGGAGLGAGSARSAAQPGIDRPQRAKRRRGAGGLLSELPGD